MPVCPIVVVVCCSLLNQIRIESKCGHLYKCLFCLGDAMETEKDAHEGHCNRIKIRFDLIKIDWMKRMDAVNTCLFA